MHAPPKKPVALLRKILNSRFVLWFVLTIPAFPLVIDLVPRQRYYAEVMYETGLLSCQFLVLTLAITPLMRLLRGYKTALIFLNWFAKRRRYFGLASFGYAFLHTAFYVRESDDFYTIAVEFTQYDLLVGWLALALMILPAVTSNNFSVRRLGLKWKLLQRLTYAAAALTALHWLLIDQFIRDLWMWSLPVIALQTVRLAYPHAKRAYQLSSLSGN